jgi:hypothetical protein
VVNVSLAALPRTAAWQHRQARSGFEVAHFESGNWGYCIRGTTTATEDGQAWVVSYEIDLDASWQTRRARIAGRSAAGPHQTLLEADGAGHWWINGEHAPHVDGCLDVDLESSAMTNTIPVHRLEMAVGDHVTAPAVYVRAVGLAVERLEQTYARIADDDDCQLYNYSAPSFDFNCQLVYDHMGLVLDYPGIAVRAC